MKQTDHYDEFRNLLRKAIGERSQITFSKECGISPEHVSRMLNHNKFSRPSVETLEKIATHACGGVTLEQLYASCGYPPRDAEKTELEKRSELSDDERIWLTVRDLKTGFKAMTSKVRLWADMERFLDDFKAYYAVEDVKYEFTGEKAYRGSQRAHSELCGGLRLLLVADTFVSSVYAAVFFSRTQGGRIIVTEVAFDGASLLDAEVFSDKVQRALSRKGKSSSAIDISVICETKYLDLADAVGKGGADDDGKYPHTKTGIGFVVDGIHDDILLDFMKNHRDSFCEDNVRTDMYNKAVSGMPLDDVFDGFTGGLQSSDAGKYAVIPAVISSESKVGFVLWNNPDRAGTFTKNRPCVVVPHLEPSQKIHPSTLVSSVARRYAEELRVPKYGVCRYVDYLPAGDDEEHEIEYAIGDAENG